MDGTYRLELEDGWVGYDPETGVIELVTRLSDVVTVEATAARMVSGRTELEEIRSQLTANQRRLDALLISQRVTAELGVDRYLDGAT